jgi:hypothetical protein
MSITSRAADPTPYSSMPAPDEIDTAVISCHDGGRLYVNPNSSG